MRIVILAAGQGTRMKAELPKVLVPIKGKPMLEYLVKSVIASGVDKNPIIIVSPSNEDLIKKALAGYPCQYAVQDKQLGTGHALACARKLVGDVKRLICFYGDHPFVSASTIKQLAKSSNGPITMMTVKLPDFSDWRVGFYQWGRLIRIDGQLKAVIEFKDSDEGTKMITEVNPGFYCFNCQWLWHNIDKLKNENAQGEYYLTDLVKLAFEQRLNINTIPIKAEEAIGINTKEELDRVEKIF